MDNNGLTRKQRRRMRKGRFRFWKNLFIWFIGFLSFIPIVFGSIFAVFYYFPLKDLTGGVESGMVSEKVSDTTVFELLTNIGQYGMEDLPIVVELIDDIIEENNLDEYLSIDKEKLSTLKFDGNFSQGIQGCVKVTASLNSLDAMSMLGDLANLEIFSWRLAPEYDEGAEGFNYRLYYYNDGHKYLPAYEMQNGTVVKVASQSDVIYCANLAEIPVTEVVDLIDESLGGVSIVNILETAGGIPVEQSSLITAIFGDTTISGLASFNAEDISLDVVLPREDEFGNPQNQEIYKILDTAITDVNADGKIQLSELDTLEVNNISLDVVLSKDDAPDIYNILESVITDSNSDGLIQIGELSSFDIDNFSLEVVLPREDEFGNPQNQDIYELLDSAITDTNADGKIQISELQTLNVDNLLSSFILEDFLPREDEHGNKKNEELYKILDCAITDTNGDGKIQISELETLDFDKVIDEFSLEDFLPREDEYGNKKNEDIYKFLDGAITDTNADGKIQFSELESLTVDNIDLETILPRADAPEIYKILDSALGNDALDGIQISELSKIDIDSVGLNVVVPRQDELGNAINQDIYKILDSAVTDTNGDGEIQVGELTTLKAGNINLEVILPRADAPDVYKILDSALGDKATDGILISELNSLKIDDIKLETVIPREDEFGNAINQDIYKILESALNKSAGASITIGEIAGFNINSVTLESVLPREDAKNKPVYDILDSALGNKVNDGIQISELGDFNVEDISLESVLKRSESKNQTIYNILDSALGDKASDGIQVKDLSNFEVDKISLETVLPRADAPEVYKILDSALNKTSGDKITIGELGNLKINNIALETVLPRTDENGNAINKSLYSILDNALTDTNEDGVIQVGELGTLEMGKIVLSSIIPHDEENEKLYNVLEDLYGAAIDEITLDQLHDFNTENLHLGVALPRETHAKLYEVLESAITLPEGVSKIENIKLGELDSCFNKENILIEKIIGENQVLEVILQDAFGKPYNKVTMGDLKNFEMSGVKLSSVLDQTGNAILDKLIEKNVKIGELGTEVNKLTLYEVYGEKCFTTTAIDGAQRFTKTTLAGKAVYTLDASGEYYLKKDAGIWLLLSFDAEIEILTGKATKYTQSTATIADLEQGTTISSKILNSTIRQLVDAGILESANENVMPFTIQQAIDALSENLG